MTMRRLPEGCNFDFFTRSCAGTALRQGCQILERFQLPDLSFTDMPREGKVGGRVSVNTGSTRQRIESQCV
jgi:hypothetical protein